MTREEAIQIIRETYHTDEEMKALESLIPELESEDERVRKAIDEILKLDKAWQIAGNYGLTVVNIRKYLEKQDQNPAWSEEDDVMFKTAKKIIWESEASDGTTNKVISWLEGRFKSIRLNLKK